MSYVKSRLALLKSVLQYLDSGQHLQKVRQAASKCRDMKSCLVYNFSVDIDLGCIFEQNASLGANIISQPLESASLFQEVIFQFCQSHCLLPAETSLSQVCARLRITQFPSDFYSLQISDVGNLTKYLNYKGFARLVGLVTGMSGPAKYTQSTKYICPNKECNGHVGNHFIRMHVPGASESRTIRNDFICIFCGTTLEEVKSLRTLSDKVIIEVTPIQLQDFGQKEVIRQGRMQAVPVLVRDDLSNIVELGKAYEIIGMCCTDIHGEEISITLEANNVIKLHKYLPWHTEHLPAAVQEIHNKCMHSHWSFPLNMAYRFGDLIAPGGVMIKLRLLLLMSLVLCPKERCLHILSLGQETQLMQALMEYAMQFAVRSSPANSLTSLNGIVTNDKCTWAPYFIQCGCLVLSGGGICSVGDITAWKKTSREQLQTVLTSNKVFLGLASKYIGGLAQQVTCPLECHVWGICDPQCSGAKMMNQKDDVMGSCSIGDLRKGFLDAFNYICFLDSGDSVTEYEILNEVMQHTVRSWCKPMNSDCVLAGLEAKDLEQYIAVCRHTEVKLSQEAESLIYSYYTASRAARSSGLSGSAVPPSALYSLTSLAIAFAKLKLKPTADECDALMAIFLYEENLTARYGLSILSIQPQPHISNRRIADFLGKQNDLAMQQFHIQLLRFCARAVDDSFNREE